jgi:CBS domain-containing protein
VHVLTLNRIGAVVISPDGAAVEGIVSERDIVQHLDRQGAAVLDSPLSAVMARPVHTCSLGDDVAHLMATMTNLRIRHLPVVEGDALAGMVSIGDVVKARVDELEVEGDRLREYIGAR